MRVLHSLPLLPRPLGILYCCLPLCRRYDGLPGQRRPLCRIPHPQVSRRAAFRHTLGRLCLPHRSWAVQGLFAGTRHCFEQSAGPPLAPPRSCPVMRHAISRLRPDWLDTVGTVCSSVRMHCVVVEGPTQTWQQALRPVSFHPHTRGKHCVYALPFCRLAWAPRAQPRSAGRAGTTCLPPTSLVNGGDGRPCLLACAYDDTLGRCGSCSCSCSTTATQLLKATAASSLPPLQLCRLGAECANHARVDSWRRVQHLLEAAAAAHGRAGRRHHLQLPGKGLGRMWEAGVIAEPGVDCPAPPNIPLLLPGGQTCTSSRSRSSLHLLLQSTFVFEHTFEDGTPLLLWM